MASAGNPSNQQPFDMNKLFKPSSGPPPTSSSTPVASNTSPFPPTMAPPAPPTPYFSSTGATSSSSSSFPPSFHLYSPLSAEQQQQQQMMANAHHHYQHRPISYPSSPPSIPPNLPPSSNTPNSGGARLMALLGSNNTNPNVSLDNPQQVQLSAPFSSSGVSGLTAATPPEFSMPVNPPPVIPSAPPANFMATSQPTPVRFPSRKLPKGRHLIVQQITYDIDSRLPGEMQPQLEVTPITKYVSDPGLVLGRQIAVNRTYICYGLRQGNIRVLNINTALRSLLRGHTQRVSDMAFFADDVHLLASASIDGRVFIWKINEDPDEEEKPQIDGKIVVALQITGEGEAVHPRICWHCHKQVILVVAFRNHILKIDSIKLGKVEFSAEEPLKCRVDKLINGVQLVGKHESEITELSMCQWMTTRLASASLDGTVKIWEDRKAVPLAILRPHDDQPVSSVSFLTSPHRPDHIVLITGGPLNREVKVWTSVSAEGWLLPSDSESWRCTQTLEFRSSTEPKIENAFFNQVMALPQACLLLLANAKKNAIYAVHIDYGPNPAATRMDYIAEFTVTMPILSLTVTSESLPGGEHVVQVYCVQTQAIQQYALDLTQCLPSLLESAVLDATDSSDSRAFDGASSAGSAPMEVSHSNKPAEMPLSSAVPVPATTTTAGDSDPVTSHPVSLSSADTAIGVSSNGAENFQTMTPIALGSRASGQLSDFRSPPNSSEPSPHNSATAAAEKLVVDGRVEAINETWVDPPLSHSISQKDEEYVTHHDVSDVSSSPLTFKHPTHLITPSEILFKAIPSSENSQTAAGMVMGNSKVQDVAVNKDVESIEVDVKVVDEGQGGQGNEFQPTKEPRIIAMEEKEKSFFSQASDIGIQMARDFRREAYDVDVPSQTCKDDVNEELLRHNASEKEIRGPEGDIPAKSGEMVPPTVPQFPVSSAKGKRHKGKNSQASTPSLSCPSPFNSTDPSNGPGTSSGTPSMVTALSQVMAMQEMLDQVVNMQKEMQKQMSMMVSAPVTKEGKRLESSFGRSMEKVVKANMDALWAHFQEENAKHEKLERDHMQQLTGLFTNCVNKDLPVLLEKTWKKEIAALGPTVARAIAPVLEKAISTAIADSVQKGIGDKAIGQLERLVNSKLETTVARQIQAQFQTSGKQALQDALKSSFEATVIPSFEGSCRTMFDQVDATLHKGLIKHATVSQQQFESTLSPLAVSLRDAINSASSITQTLNGELADGQRKLLTIASATANTNPLVTQLSNGPLAGIREMTEASTDPSKELSRLISDHKYEEAFTTALHRSDVSVVSWLCSQVDLKRILSSVPIPLSQGVLLALLQQLSCDIHRETMKKLAWVTDVAVAINPTDPMIVVHVRPIFEQVYQILGHQRNLPSASAAEASSIHVLMHVINSMLMSCK